MLPGEPKVPPANPYALFTKLMIKSFPRNISSKERLTMVSEKWKECSNEEKEKYKEEQLKLREQYILDLHKFYENLVSPEEKSKFQMRHKSRMNEILSVNISLLDTFSHP